MRAARKSRKSGWCIANGSREVPLCSGIPEGPHPRDRPVETTECRAEVVTPSVHARQDQQRIRDTTHTYDDGQIRNQPSGCTIIIFTARFKTQTKIYLHNRFM